MLLRFAVNVYKFNRIKVLHLEYWKYVRENKSEFVENKEEIVALFKDAGLKDSEVMHQELLGYGQIANLTVSVFDNLTNIRNDIVGIIDLKFKAAKGVYKKRYKDSYNPIFWIDFILKLPIHIMEFIGVMPEKMAAKIFLLLYWIAAVVLGWIKIDF